ncbi:DUF502 domain-containing protein [Neptunomonas antarctica]|uniref:Uncharacterized membrane protein n=1 Tax=Neptunomonas antarctica TaxID=619304 RepID=A0A1N7N7Y6_9GAMM|nr:DUF502 domain-containing protein [Neptunomonas antarctica]SIS94378.1 Uncharacterized membrane protein [Neptunomonas antarctica]
MNRIFTFIWQGLIAVLPLGLTVYFIYWLFSFMEALAKPLLLSLISLRFYFPGLGILASILALVLVGILVNLYGIRYLVKLVDHLLERIPVVKSVYSTIQDIVTVFNITDKKDDLRSAVLIDMGNDINLIGFVTGAAAGRQLFKEGNKVGVYLPMSYQIGGFTVYVEQDRLTPLDVSVEAAMRMAITAGVKAKKKS